MLQLRQFIHNQLPPDAQRKKVASVDDIDPAAQGADRFIYMVPKTGGKNGDKFDEYMPPSAPPGRRRWRYSLESWQFGFPHSCSHLRKGSLNGPDGLVSRGMTVTVTVEAAAVDGYHFVNWQEKGQTVSGWQSCRFPCNTICAICSCIAAACHSHKLPATIGDTMYIAQMASRGQQQQLSSLRTGMASPMVAGSLLLWHSIAIKSHSFYYCLIQLQISRPHR